MINVSLHYRVKYQCWKTSVHCTGAYLLWGELHRPNVRWSRCKSQRSLLPRCAAVWSGAAAECRVTSFSSRKCPRAPCTRHDQLPWTATPVFISPDIWPPNGPNLNPVDCKIWGIVQHRVYQSRVHNVDELKQHSDCWRFGTRCSRPSATVQLTSCAISLKFKRWRGEDIMILNIECDYDTNSNDSNCSSNMKLFRNFSANSCVIHSVSSSSSSFIG